MFKENKSEDSNMSPALGATGSKKLKSVRAIFPTGFSADILNTARILQLIPVNLLSLSQPSLPCFPLENDTVSV